MQPGTRLGRYEILSALGKGGMGEVWRARDTQLGRDVAIKTLPEPFAHDPDRRARFEREARLLAAVNHPNIAVIYGLEESDRERFLALELVEGETLAERLRRGALPVEQALKLALQIAEALEAAHERGVVHRDLKPANIKVTPEGKVKVLDFGLAKAFGAAGRNDGLSSSPTLSLAAAEGGVVFGTAAYMAPEQARGEAVDVRADVWAFGCLLYELLTSRRAFAGATLLDTIAAVLEHEPDWSAGESLAGILAHELRAHVNGRVMSCIDWRGSPDEPISAVLAGAIDRSFAKLDEARRELTASALEALEAQTGERLLADLEGDTWRSTFRGRDILSRFVGTHVSGTSYQVFRNILLDKMAGAGFEPTGMKSVLEQLPLPARIAKEAPDRS